LRYKLLGRSGLRVSELALGTMSFSDTNSDGKADKTVSEILFDSFVEAGGNFIDSANDYSGGRSETHLGKFIWGTTYDRIDRIRAIPYVDPARLAR
jgi:aryl-alcohol dehydrogenase-like predicted oxidoreductase